MAERSLPPGLKTSLLAEDVHTYLHLVKFEKPRSAAESQFIAKKATDYAYISDAPYNVTFDDGSKDSKGNSNGPQVYVANKLLKVGTVNETTEAKASNMNIELSGTALGTTLITNATFTSTTITTTSDLLDEGFQEGDVILLEGTGFANNGKYVRIDKFTNSNQTITVTGIDCVVTADSTAREYTFSFASDEIQAILTSKEATNYVNYINREVIIYKAHVNPETGAVIGGDNTGPFVIFRGIISKASVKDNVLQKSKVLWNLTSHWGDFIRVQGRVTSDYSHRALSVTGVSDKDALLRPEYEFDAGFAHAEKSINVLSTYQTMETRYKMKKRGGLAGLIGLKKVVEYQVEVDREVDLQFNLTARYLPVVYGVQRVDSIPIFADINKNLTNHVYVAHAICEGEIGGIYDVYIDENSSVCLDLNDSNARSSTSSNAAVLCSGRADKGDVLAGASGRTTTVVNFLEDGEENQKIGSSPGGFNSVFRQPRSGTSFNSSGAQGIQHEDTFTFESPITTNLFIHTGKPHQDANDTLVSQAKSKLFKIQNEFSDGDKNNYWSPNHRLLDTAYVVGKYIIKEGDTTIPKLEFVVRGKKIKAYNYDFSYDTDTTGSNASHTNFTLGTTVTLHRTKAEGSNAADSQIGSAVTIIDKWAFYRNTSTLHYRFRFSENPQDGVSTQFYMKDGSGNKWHMIAHDHEDQPTPVNLGTTITGNVTAIGAYNSGAGTSGTRTITISANLPFHLQTAAGHFVSFNFSGIETTEAFRVVSTDNSNNTIVVNDNGRGLPLIKQLLEAGNTCTLRNMNMIVLNASAAPNVDNAYNGRKIVITRFDSDDTILKEEERQIVTYETASDSLPKIATLDVPMPFDFSPEATDFYVIHSGEDEEDIRVSINPAIQLLDYLKDKKHGKGLDDSDIDFPSFLQAARDCETRSDVTVQVVGDVTGSLDVGDVYEYAPSSVVKFRGTVKSRETKVVNVTATNGSVSATTFTQVIFNNVMGKLAYKWTNWRTFADNDYYWNKGLLYLKSGSGTVTSEPTSGHITTNITLSKVSGSGSGNSLTVSIQDTYNSSGNPVIKKFTNIVEGFNSPGYSLYDSDDVKYWIYLGWDEPEQRFVTRHQMNQIIDTSVPIFDNINSMLKQFNGILRYANGKYGLAIKQAAPSSFETYQTITDDDIIGEMSVQDGGQKQSFNSMAANVIDPQNKFNARSITYFNSDYLKQDKGIRRSGNFAMPGVSNYFNSRINIQQFLDESRYGLDISFKIDSKGLLLLTGEIIQVTNSRLGFNNKLFRISNLNFLSNCLVQVTAVEHNDSAYLVGNIKTAPAAKEIEDQGGTVNETVVATPESPSGLTATTNAKGAIDLSWSNSSSFSTATHMTEVFASSTNDRTNATSIFNTQATIMSHLITVQSLTEKYYWVRHTVVAENGQIVNSDFHPTSSTGGVLGSATGAVDGAQGERGPGRWHIQVSSLPTTSALANSRWNDGTGSQPTVAVEGDQAFFYTGTISNPTAQKVWIYAGSNNWTEQVEVIDGDLLVQGTVTADRMVANTITANEIAANAITASEIAADAVTTDKLAAGAVTADEIGANAITTVKLAADAITTDKIAADAITATEIDVSNLAALSANLGAVTAGTLKGGSIPDANAAPSGSEAGAFMDLTGGKMVFGKSNKHILFDGTDLILSGVTIDANSIVNATAGVAVEEDGTQESSAATILNFTTGLNLAVTGSAPNVKATVSLDSGFATLASPTFTGTPRAPTATAGTNTTQLATTAFVGTAVSDLVGAAPSDLDTLNELAAALADDASFSSTVNTALGNRLRIDTASQGLNSTQKTNALTNLGIPNVDNLSAASIRAGTTASDVGLGNVTNESKSTMFTNPTFTGTVSGVSKSAVNLGNVDNLSAASIRSGTTASDVGLGNVDNTSDANKPVSTAQQTALNAKASLSGATFTGTVAGISKSMVGLGNVDNTSDANKPVSTAQQTALNAKANLASPTFTGTPIAPTATSGTNTTQIATTAFVQTAASSAASGAVNDGLLDINEGNLIDLTISGGDFTANKSTETDITINVDLSELTDMTDLWVTSVDEFVVLDNGVQKRKRSSEIFGSNAFNSTAFTTNTGTVTSVGTNTGLSGTVTTSGNLSLALNDLSAETADIVGGSDHVIYLDGGTQKKKLFNQLKLSQFNNDAGFATTAGVSGSISSAVNDGTLRIFAGDGMGTNIASDDNLGSFTANSSSGTDIVINHANTSDQASSNNSGRTYIQDITLDTFGHVTGIATATETVTNTEGLTSITAGSLIDVTGSGSTQTVNVDLSELTDMTQTWDNNVDEFVVLDNGSQKRKRSTEIFGSNAFNSTSFLTGNQTITLSGDVSGSGTTSINVTVADDSHNHVISNIDGLQSALDGKQASGTYVTSLSSTTTNQLTVTDGSTATPELNIVTGAVANSGTALATGDQIHTFVTGQGFITDVVQDTTPQLGGNLDVQAREINTSTTNGNIKLNPNGTGYVEIRGDGTTNGTTGAIQLNCSNNNHGVKIQSPPHSAGASYTITLPTSDGNANQVLQTDGSGVTSWVDQTSGMSSISAVANSGIDVVDGSTSTPEIGTTGNLNTIATASTIPTLAVDFLEAGTINADHITADTINATHIDANAVTAEQLQISNNSSGSAGIFMDYNEGQPRIDIRDSSALRVRIGYLA